MLLAAATAARGAEQAVGKYAQAAAEERELARSVREGWAVFVGDLQRHEAFIREDAKLAMKDVEAEAALHLEAAKAFDREDLEEGRRIRASAAEALKRRTAWKERIYDYRRKQAEAAPSEQSYADEMRWHRYPNAQGELDALCEAKKALSEAWGRVADAAGPDRDADSLTDLKEAAYSAELERDIAEMRYLWAKQRDEIRNDKKVWSDAMEQRQKELQAVQERRVELKRAEAAREREDRRIEREIRLAVEAYRAAYEEAAKAQREKSTVKK